MLGFKVDPGALVIRNCRL